MKRTGRGAWSTELDYVEESIGANVATFRGDRGLTQQKLAHLVGITIKTLQRVERGSGNCTARVLAMLARVLEVPVENLFKPAKVKPAQVGRPRKKALPEAQNTAPAAPATGRASRVSARNSGRKSS